MDWVDELTAVPINKKSQHRLEAIEAQLAEYESLHDQIRLEITAAKTEADLVTLRDELTVVQAELTRLNMEWEGLSGHHDF